MKPDVKITRLSELCPGQSGDCFALLVAKERGKTRDGKPYYRVTFRDAQRTVTSMIWSDTVWFADCEQQWTEDGFYKLRCLYTESQYGPQVDIDRIREVTDEDKEAGFDPRDFCPTTRFDVDTMFAELVDLAKTQISDPALSRLVVEILTEHAVAIKQSAAAARYHHAFAGGYLEHTLSVTRTAVFLADKYSDYYSDMQPPLSKSLVVAGAILHDVGKLEELTARPSGSEYSAKGRLIGHILLGRDLIREKAAAIEELDSETQLRLEHIIISHQNLPEWGSPVAPHTPEALLVYFADDLDAKFHEMAVALADTATQDDEFTGRDNALRRRIFRHLK